MADSNCSSRAHTSSPSPSASTSTPDNKPKKRTRASKPKVRTGCITCKIRRVKCGEEKPACYRCTSTGRTCDGYDNGTPLRHRTPQDSLQEAELKRAEFLRTYQWNESVRSMRPIVADIDGTEMEKKFFHRFRTATEDSLAAHHMGTFTPFWTRLAPRISHHDDAVKHAAIALGAAHQLYQPTSDALPDSLSPENIEVFIIQQYNKSISKLQRHVGSSSPDSIKVTLICCLAYICLETLRSSHQAVVTHLMNGLKILQSLPPATFDFLGDPSSYAPSPRDVPAALDNNSLFEMADIIRIFGKLECSACFFVTGIHPVVAEYGYKYRRFDDGSRETAFVDLRSAQSAIVCFARDVVARVYQVGAVSDHYYFWADMSQQRQQACLRERSRRLETLLINDFLTRPGALPGTGAPDTPETLCFYVNLLHFRNAQLLLNGIDQRIPTSVPSSPSQPYPPPTLTSTWQQQQQFQLPHHTRPAASPEALVFSQNLDPRLAAQTLVQMQMETSPARYGSSVQPGFGSNEEMLPLNSNNSRSMPPTPGSHYSPAHPPQHVPFPFLVFTNSGSKRPVSPGNPTTSRLLHEIVHIAEIVYNSPSSRRFRDLNRRGRNYSTLVRAGGGRGGGSVASSSNPDTAAALNRRPYSYAFTSDTGLLGPLSLVALVAVTEHVEEEEHRATSISSGRGKAPGHLDVNRQAQGRVLRNKALGMLKEYASLGRGGRIAGVDDRGEQDAEGEEETLAAEEEGLGSSSSSRASRGGTSGGRSMSDGERFWVEYFRMLGFMEVLTPGSEHVRMHDYGLV